MNNNKIKEQRDPSDTINISNELTKTTIWKDLVKSEDDLRAQKKKLSLKMLTKRGSQKRTKSGASNQSNEIQTVEIPLLNKRNSSNRDAEVSPIVEKTGSVLNN